MTTTEIAGAYARVSRTIDAPSGRVYQAWTDPAMLKAWAWGSLGKATEAIVDLRTGGRYEISTEASRPVEGFGPRHAMRGIYIAIVPGRRLVYTLRWDAPVTYNEGGKESLDEVMCVDFIDQGSACEVQWMHLGIPDEESATHHAAGNAHTLEALADLLSG